MPEMFLDEIQKKIQQTIRSLSRSLPGGMDKILKNYFDSCRKKGIVPPEILSIDKNLKLFCDTEKLKKWRKVVNGINWVDKEGNVITGGLDDVFEKKNKLIVADYKIQEDGRQKIHSQIDTNPNLKCIIFFWEKIREKTENLWLYFLLLSSQNSKFRKCKI